VRSTASVTPALGEQKASALRRVRRDIIVLSVLIGAVALLIFNGSSLFWAAMSGAGGQFAPEIKVASVALTLNVALILFGWRRYADLLYEAERRLEGEERAAHMAVSDAITGLANRKGFADRGEQLRDLAASRGEWLAVMSLRMHRFKSINDRHGYEVGDDLLRAIAEAISAQVGDDSIAARLNGDEFAMAFIVPQGGSNVADKIGEAVLQSVTRPFEISGKMLQVGSYIGVAAAPPAKVAVPDLLRRADIALDHACNRRVARPLWFDSGMERALIALSEIEQGLRYGLEHDQFVPYFEPQIDLNTGHVIGFEVLARWQHPSSGLVMPDSFISVAEEMGLIGQLSEQVMRAAFQEAADWDPAIKLSVNIAPTQLADPWLAQKIVRCLTETRFPANRLVVEVTESSLFTDIELARTIAASLKNQGIRLALDDFGSGFSSLSHLRSLPFDVIKIDRTFTATIHHDAQSAAIVRAVTSLAKALDVPVTVEGIEDAATHAAVLGFGCAVGQGWYFGKPMTAHHAAEMLARRDRAETGPRAARA
jgi:diguanylate cyclase (GGDEF)-like protein